MIDLSILGIRLSSRAPSASSCQVQAGQSFSAVMNSALSAGENLSCGETGYDGIFAAAAEQYGIPVSLLKAVGMAESGFQADAVSSCGASGIMQLMPGTASYLGVRDRFDPQQNIMGGAKYLRQMLDRFDGQVPLALAAYNAGPGTVDRYDGVPPFTREYVSRVLCYADGYAGNGL